MRSRPTGANDEPGMNALRPEHGAHDGCHVLADAGSGFPGAVDVRQDFRQDTRSDVTGFEPVVVEILVHEVVDCHDDGKVVQLYSVG